MQRRGLLLAAAAVVLAVPSAAHAATTTPILVTDQTAADRGFVTWLVAHEPRAAVKSAAQTALNNGATAVTTFIDSGYTGAVNQAAQTRTTQLDFANQAASTHPAATYPWVNATAQRAANGTDAELAAYSATGYPAALAKDNAKVPYDDGAAQVTDESWSFVRALASTNLGSAVTQRLSRLRTDADAAEFLRYGLISAAGVDSDQVQAQYVADEWSRYREAKYWAGLGTSGNPAAAVQGWQNLINRLGGTPQTWAAFKQAAQKRTNDWSTIAAQAGYSSSPLLASLATEAPGIRALWASEVTNATERTAWWTDLITYAQTALHSRG